MSLGIIEELKDRINILIKYTAFELDCFLCDEKHFGNIIILLKYKNLMIRIIQDRGYSVSEFSFEKRQSYWIGFENAFKTLEIELKPFPKELILLVNHIISIDESILNNLLKYENKRFFDKLVIKVNDYSKQHSSFYMKTKNI